MMRFESGSALLKGVAVTVVAIIMLLPLGMLEDLVAERTALRGQAIGSVAQGWGGRQIVGGPVLAIPVTWNVDEKKTVVRDWYVLPESLSMQAALVVAPEPRRLGIYEVPVYTATIRSTGTFDVARQMERLTASSGPLQIHFDRARLLLPIRDLRGVRGVVTAPGLNAPGSFEPARGFPLTVLAAPLRTDVPIESRPYAFDVTLEVAGTESLSFLPLARSTQVRLAGNWLHPGFTSGFLPIEHRETARGFEAGWRVLDVNRSYGARWFEGDASLAELEASAFGPDLVRPVDLYQRVTRAVKYAALFIAVSLLALFLVEQLLRRHLHPLQYGLLGLALSVFYLLLLALSEHIGFGPAYLAAATALCLLMGAYLAGTLGGRRAGLTAAAAFATVYALLYLLVTSEDYALLAGSLALFALLATLMLLTRRLDWYGSGSATE